MKLIEALIATGKPKVVAEAQAKRLSDEDRKKLEEICSGCCVKTGKPLPVDFAKQFAKALAASEKRKRGANGSKNVKKKSTKKTK